ncbi:MAG: 2-hydroxyacid dehydrogenase, partial [Caulobacteraceae bacterium]
MSARPVVLVIPPHLGPVGAMLEGQAEVIRLWENPDPEVLSRGRVIVTAGEFALERALTGRMPDLGLVAFIGAGYDGIDLAWAKAKGV